MTDDKLFCWAKSEGSKAIKELKIDIDLPDATIKYYPNFISYDDSLLWLDNLYQQCAWRQDRIVMFGKLIDIPRLQAWYGDRNADYCYSKLKLTALAWTPLLADIKQRVEVFCEQQFNSVLVNCYRDHQDSMGWHSDDEPELGNKPIIASLSLGANRVFQLKHKSTGQKFKLPLQSGSLLVMSGTTQSCWQHAIGKTRQQQPMRINLTFRRIINGG